LEIPPLKNDNAMANEPKPPKASPAKVDYHMRQLRKLFLRGEEFNVLGEMHRIAQRQFHWQRGYFNMPQFYRYAYLYAQGECGGYFQDKFGIPITEFNFVGFALFTQSRRTPWIERTITLQELGLTEDLMKRALPLLLVSADKARKETNKIVDQVTVKHGRPIPTAYLPSILRRYPLISVKEDSESFIAPIPEVLLMRVTSGLYYDLIPGGQALLNDASERFEQYVADYIDALKAAQDSKYVGWDFPEINRKESEGKPKIQQKKFPFELDDLLPWWKRTNELKQANEAGRLD
jgi:hypothetical protein